MKLGVVYPQTELGGDPRAVHEIGVAVDTLGYDSLLFYDHVVGAEHANRQPPLSGPYTEHDPFHDPLVVFGYLAGVTHTIELATGVLILPQRQTVLLAKQAADADLLSGGRVRLGVGVGWNWVEYVALGQDFATRGARLDEQIGLLRRLWTEPLVTFEGRFDRIERGCINPRPSRMIPIWVGGFGEPAFRRGGQLGDGFTFAGSIQDATEGLTRVRHHLAQAGRSSMPFGAELITSRAADVADVVENAERWREVGGTHVSVLTTRFGFRSTGEHIDFVAAAKDALDARLGLP
jgi:probable F420-dependent oxidoreductase